MVVVVQSQTLISAIWLSKKRCYYGISHSEIPSFGQIEFREAWRVLEGFSKMPDEALDK